MSVMGSHTMANATISDVVDRAMNNEAFRMQFRSNPEAALEEFDLDEADERALLEQDDDTLIDQIEDGIEALRITFIIPAED